MLNIVVTVDSLNLEAFVRTFLDERVINKLLMGVAANARNEWLKLAGERLVSRRGPYVEGLQAVQVSGEEAIIELVGAFPNQIENGTPGFDMRETLLRGSGKRYRAIPFKHIGPEAIGASGIGTPMGKPYAAALGPQGAKQLGRDIHRAAKALPFSQGGLPAGLAPKLNQRHTTDLYAGLERHKALSRVGSGSEKVQSRFMTFRTISEDSGLDKWMYPATEGEHLVDEVVDKLPEIADKIVSELLGGLGGS